MIMYNNNGQGKKQSKQTQRSAADSGYHDQEYEKRRTENQDGPIPEEKGDFIPPGWVTLLRSYYPPEAAAEHPHTLESAWVGFWVKPEMCFSSSSLSVFFLFFFSCTSWGCRERSSWWME
jgi:hypothetical protein